MVGGMIIYNDTENIGEILSTQFKKVFRNFSERTKEKHGTSVRIYRHRIDF
jgi:hypothetical protein